MRWDVLTRLYATSRMPPRILEIGVCAHSFEQVEPKSGIQKEEDLEGKRPRAGPEEQDEGNEKKS